MPPSLPGLADKIRDILSHVEPLSHEAAIPLLHYTRAAGDIWNLRGYVERKIKESSHYPNVAQGHMSALDRMLLVNLIEAFERFLKETAAVCVDHLATCVLDDRFNVLPVSGSLLAAHFGAESLGKSLCESSTWLDCDTVNRRFRSLLSDPFDHAGGGFWVFPHTRGQQPENERFRYPAMSLLWQLRHTMVHNVGQITQSDAVKFQLLARRRVESPRVLVPTRDDVRYVKRFLVETARSINGRVADRLAELLTAFHLDNPAVFDPREVADLVSQQFGIPLNVGGVAGSLPPP